MQLMVFIILVFANLVSAQPGPGMGPGFGPGPGHERGGPGGDRRPHEFKFNYEEDKSLFSSEAEAESYNTLLAEMKKNNPDLEKNLMDKMRQGFDRSQRPDPEQMKANFLEMKKELKALVDKEKEKTVVKEEVPAPKPEPEVIAEVKPEVNPEIVPEVVPDVKPEVKPEDVVVKKDEPITEDNRNYKPDTCVWADDIPRKIVVGAGCSVEGSRICIGYVVCEQKNGGGKFTRMSTCSEGFCGDNDAVLCTKEKGFGSFKPAPEKAEFVSGKIKDLLQNSGSGQ